MNSASKQEQPTKSQNSQMRKLLSSILPISLIAILVLGIGAVSYPAYIASARQQDVLRLQGDLAVGITTTSLLSPPFPSGSVLGIDTYKFGPGGALVLVLVYAFAGGQQSNGVSGIASGQAFPLTVYANDASIDAQLTPVFGAVPVLGPGDGISISAPTIPGTVTVTAGATTLVTVTYTSSGGTVPAFNDQENLLTGYTVVIHADRGSAATVSGTAILPVIGLVSGTGFGDITTFSLKIIGPKPSKP